MKKYILTLLLPLLISACGELQNTTSNIDTPPENSNKGSSSGQFSIYEKISGLTPQDVVNQSSITPQSVNKDFDFGDIKSSRSFGFILTNSGDSEITSVSITTTNPAFEMTPETISRIDPFEDTSALVELNLDIIHGKVLNGIGFTDLLSQGQNIATFNVTGYTVSGNETVTINLTRTVEVNALVADIEIYDGDTPIDLGAVSVPVGQNAFGKRFWISTTSKNITIKNKSNFDIHLTQSHLDNYATAFSNKDTYLLSENESKTFDISTVTETNDGELENKFIKINNQNTEYDHNIFPASDDGNIYLGFFIE